jgi:hypothetical protein
MISFWEISEFENYDDENEISIINFNRELEENLALWSVW